MDIFAKVLSAIAVVVSSFSLGASYGRTMESFKYSHHERSEGNEKGEESD